MKSALLLGDIIDMLPCRFEVYFKGQYLNAYKKEELYDSEWIEDRVVKIEADEDDICIYLTDIGRNF
ncbi:TPA: hypothetical protein ACF2DD_002130 [Clostridium perfringens]